MTPRAIRRAAERAALKAARKNGQSVSPEVSAAQLAANQANAQKSTGPRTPEGQAISSLNAVKTGLTGRTVLLPTDDAARYEKHIADFTTAYSPAGTEECALVQSLADHAWRLQRIVSLEMALFARGHREFFEEFADRAPAERDAMIQLETYLTYEKEFRNLHIQESRLVRYRAKDTAELRRLQQDRKDRAAAEEAARKPQAARPPNPLGFEFSSGPETGFISQAFVSAASENSQSAAT